MDGLSRTTEAKSAETLAGECRAGSEAAFAELVGRFRQNLQAFLHRLTGNRQDAEDLVQETFMQAFRQIGRYDQRHAFKAWLFTIGRNLAVSRLRRRRHEPVFMAPDALPDVPEPSAAPGGALMAGEAWKCLREEMARLPSGQREALWLFHAEEMPAREIALVLGKSALGVRVLLFRARRSLARRLSLQPAFAQAAATGAAEGAEPGNRVRERSSL